jgi:hypothetical protein
LCGAGVEKGWNGKGKKDSSFCESATAKAPRREKEAKKLFPSLGLGLGQFEDIRRFWGEAVEAR